MGVECKAAHSYLSSDSVSATTPFFAVVGVGTPKVATMSEGTPPTDGDFVTNKWVTECIGIETDAAPCIAVDGK